MSIQVDWGRADKAYLNIIFGESWTWDEFIQMDETINALIAEVDHAVIYLADMRAVRRLPARDVLQQARQILHYEDPRSDLTIVVGGTAYVHAMVNNVLLPIIRSDAIRLVETMEQAHAMITHRRMMLQIRQNVRQAAESTTAAS